MTSTKKKIGSPVCFLDGFTLRHGVVLGGRCGVWRVRSGGQIWHVWEEDLFTSPAGARAVLNKLVG
ncbi:hypothetical protein [Candidatus Avelusimicrobium fimicolum]|uniref:hypothetical protein n=1 Tax=Candidatus Avelusimicrobium fimicolum TaxID=3416216 RepID=UPI0020548060|nr:MAG TPA: hypothetical protein [Caudoviricetes sp.]